MILIAHPTGNQFFLQALKALQDSGQLAELWTCIGVIPGTFLDNVAGCPGFRELRRRAIPQAYRECLHTWPLREAGRLLLRKAGRRRWATNEKNPFGIDAVYHDFDRRVARRIRRVADGQVSAVYAYEDGALESFRAARERGFTTIYDLPIAYWRESEYLLKEQALRYPDWEPTLIGNRMSEEKKARKDMELELADLILCPSAFVEQTIRKHLGSSPNLAVVPFGTPIDLIPERQWGSDGEITSDGKGKPLRVLFAGTLSQRKGLADVFEAMRLVRSTHVELHLLGSAMMDMNFYRQRCPGFHYHPTRPHHEVIELMRSCDVLVLPSIVEGRAQTQLEGLACGLPLIVTANAGAEDMVDEGSTGFLVPVNSPESIAEAIDRMASDPDLLQHMKEQARIKAGSWTWAHYRERLTALIQEIASGGE